MAHPIRREDEESAILRYSSDGVLGTKYLRVASDEGVSKTPGLAAAVGCDGNNFVKPSRGERLAIAPRGGEEGNRVHGINIVPRLVLIQGAYNPGGQIITDTPR